MKLFFIIYCLISSLYAIESFQYIDSVTEDQINRICSGRYLKTPFVRAPFEEYFRLQDARSQPHKLCLGAGHIGDVSSLHVDYQPEGSNSLTSDYEEQYTFQRYDGWYTVSAETDKAFNSDMVLNLRTLIHQENLFLENSWDLIWDASYHPSVFSAPKMLTQINKSLKSKGVYITTLPIEFEDNVYIPGHFINTTFEPSEEFMHKLAYCELKFPFMEEIETYIDKCAKDLGFYGASLYKSPVTLSFESLTGTDVNSSHEADHINFSEILKKASEYAILSEATKIDPIFRHAGLGRYHIIFRKN